VLLCIAAVPRRGGSSGKGLMFRIAAWHIRLHQAITRLSAVGIDPSLVA
jgi:hypothetical protein